MNCWQEHFSSCKSGSSLFCFLWSGINIFFLSPSKLCLKGPNCTAVPGLHTHGTELALVWNPVRSHTQKMTEWTTIPHVCFCQDIPCFCCDTVHIQQHLLQHGILRDVYEAPDDPHSTAVWHTDTAGWFSARSTQLGQYTPYHKAPLIPRQTPAVTIWRHHHVAESEGICYRTGLAFIQSLHREQACRGSEGVTHGGYKSQVTWSHATACMICTTFSRTVNKMTWSRTLSQDLSQVTAHGDSSTEAKCLKEFQATFPNISTSLTQPIHIILSVTFLYFFWESQY